MMWENGEMVFVIVGEAETYLCGLEHVDAWLSAGYRLYGVADTIEDVEWLYRDALQATEG